MNDHLEYFLVDQMKGVRFLIELSNRNFLMQKVTVAICSVHKECMQSKKKTVRNKRTQQRRLGRKRGASCDYAFTRETLIIS